MGARRAPSDVRPGLGEDRAQDLLDLVEVLLAADQRGRHLDHGVSPVVGPAVQTGLEQRLGQESAQQSLGLFVVEGLLGRLVLDHLVCRLLLEKKKTTCSSSSPQHKKMRAYWRRR